MYFEQIIQQHQETIENMLKKCVPDIQKVADICRLAIRNGQTIFFCGNGGSAADCQHIAAEFVGRFVKERQGLPAIALTTDTSILTSIGNDYGFEHVFERQVSSLVRNGDVVVGLSTSGNSTNVVLALEEAKNLGAAAIALTGAKRGKLCEIADAAIRIPSENTARVQECHILIGHMVCQYTDEEY